MAIGSVSYLRVSAFIRGYLLTRIRRKNQPQKSTRSTKTDSSLQQFVLSVPLRGYRFGFLSACIRVYPRLLIYSLRAPTPAYRTAHLARDELGLRKHAQEIFTKNFAYVWFAVTALQ